MPTPTNLLTFLRTVGRLKATKRSGWVLYGLHSGESVADHTTRTGLAAMVLANGPNAARVTKMALVHDLAESHVGDITPLCGVSDEEKYRREREALVDIVSNVEPPVAHEILSLWDEFEEGKTYDATLVRDIDKLELILQAEEYEAEHGMQLQSFFDSTEGVFRTEKVRAVVDELHRQRKQRKDTEHVTKVAAHSK